MQLIQDRAPRRTSRVVIWAVATQFYKLITKVLRTLKFAVFFVAHTYKLYAET